MVYALVFIKHPYIAKEELYALCYLVLSDLKCVAIEGCSGSGKTTLLKNFIQLFQRKVGEDVVFLHLGDQIDSKVILCHCCKVCMMFIAAGLMFIYRFCWGLTHPQ